MEKNKELTDLNIKISDLKTEINRLKKLVVDSENSIESNNYKLTILKEKRNYVVAHSGNSDLKKIETYLKQNQTAGLYMLSNQTKIRLHDDIFCFCYYIRDCELVVYRIGFQFFKDNTTKFYNSAIKKIKLDDPEHPNALNGHTLGKLKDVMFPYGKGTVAIGNSKIKKMPGGLEYINKILLKYHNNGSTMGPYGQNIMVNDWIANLLVPYFRSSYNKSKI